MNPDQRNAYGKLLGTSGYQPLNSGPTINQAYSQQLAPTNIQAPSQINATYAQALQAKPYQPIQNMSLSQDFIHGAANTVSGAGKLMQQVPSLHEDIPTIGGLLYNMGIAGMSQSYGRTFERLGQGQTFKPNLGANIEDTLNLAGPVVGHYAGQVLTRVGNKLEDVKNLLKNPEFSAALAGEKGAVGNPFGNEAKAINEQQYFHIENPAVTYKPITSLVSHESAADVKAVEAYKQKLLGHEPIPPIYVKEENGKFGVEDGKHRLEAYKQLGANAVPTIELKPSTMDRVRAAFGDQSGKIKLGPGEEKPQTPQIVKSFEEMHQNASDPVEYINNLNKLTHQAMEFSSPQELKAYRTALNKARFQLAGTDGTNWKRDFAYLQNAKGDSSIGPMIRSIEDNMGVLDNKIKANTQQALVEEAKTNVYKVLPNKNSTISKNTYKLPEVLNNKALFEKYPELKGFNVHFGTTEGSTRAGLVDGSRSIILGKTNYDVIPDTTAIQKLQKSLEPFLEKEATGTLSKVEYAQAAKISDEIGALQSGKNGIGVKLNENGLRSLIHEVEHAKQQITGKVNSGSDFLSENAAGSNQEAYFKDQKEIAARLAEEKHLPSYTGTTQKAESLQSSNQLLKENTKTNQDPYNSLYTQSTPPKLTNENFNQRLNKYMGDKGVTKQPTIDRTQLTGKQLSTSSEVLAERQAKFLANRGTPVDEFQQQVLDKNPEAVAQMEQNNLKNKPFKSVTPPADNLKGAITTHDAVIKKAVADANMQNLQLKGMADKLGITPEQEWALVNYAEKPTPEYLKELQGRGLKIDQELVDHAKPLLDLHRQIDDARLTMANAQGIETNKLQNHVRHVYSNTPDEIQNALNNYNGKGLKKTPGFTKQREFPTYPEAQDYGLTPKYSTFGQINAHDTADLGKSVANKQLQDYLIRTKSILPATQAPQGWKPIYSDFFPRTPDGEPYYVAPDKADMVNNYFGGAPQSPASKGLDIIGKVSARLQSLLLTTPGQTVHGFTIANMLRDAVAGLGDLAWGHPIRGARTALAGPVPAIRGFIPGLSTKFAEGWERANADAISQLASTGQGYSGMFNFKNVQDNVVNPEGFKLGDIPHNVENMVVSDPTFHKFMFQRKVELFKNFRDSLTSQGYALPEAIDMAGKQLAKYDGVVNDLGRNPDVNNFLKTFFFAPKYREGIINSQVNAVKGFLNPGNKEFDMSRRLGLGLAMTFFAYNALNMKNTGHPMWQNGAGHEFDVAFHNPNDPKKNYFIPWMPGTTTVPRAVVGTGIALAKGDSKTAAQQASTIMSSPLQTLSQAATGQDYFGRSIIDPSKPALPQQIGYAAKQMLLPGGINQLVTAVGNAQQGKQVNPAIEAARVFQLPIKEGQNIDNPQVASTNAYFNGLKTATQGLNQNQLATWNGVLHPTTKDANGNSIVDKTAFTKPQYYITLLNDPKLMAAETNFQASQPNHHPMWDLTPQERQAYMQAQVINGVDPSGDKATVSGLKAVLPQGFSQKVNQFYSNLQAQGVQLPPNNNYVQTPPEIQKFWDVYTQQPKGTGIRSALLKTQVGQQALALLDQQTQLTNNQRADMGLPLLPTGNSASGYSSKPKVAKIKLAKVKSVRLPKIRAVKPKSFKSLKVAKVKTIKLPRRVKKLQA